MSNGIRSVYYNIGADRQMLIAYSDGDSVDTVFATDVTACRCELVNEPHNTIAAVSADALLSVQIGDPVSVFLEICRRHVTRKEKVGSKDSRSTKQIRWRQRRIQEQGSEYFFSQANRWR